MILIISHLFAALADQFHSSGLRKQFEMDKAKVSQIGSGTYMLLVGMVSWLGIITVTVVIVFIIVYKRLHNSQQDDMRDLVDDAESVISETFDKSSIVDLDSVYDDRYMQEKQLPLPPLYSTTTMEEHCTVPVHEQNNCAVT